MTRRKFYRLRSNPSAPRPGLQYGRKVMDDQTGARTYEAFIVTDTYGNRVDVRGQGYDYPGGDMPPERHG